MLDLMYDIPSSNERKQVVVTEDMVLGRTTPRLEVQKKKRA
jgi:ATP-dependent protease Clp ATPase subunit